MVNRFSIDNTILPEDTRSALGKVVKNNPKEISNFALQLNKCANFFAESNGKMKPFFYKTQKGAVELALYPSFTHLKEAKWTLERALKICTKYERLPNLVLEWRLAIGMGNASVFENGITLHHVYGFPYLPASSIKGIANHWAQHQGHDIGNKKDVYLKIFGSDAEEGRVIFFDAYPDALKDGFSNDSSIQPDIINNHYQAYYNGDKPPADWHSPVPIFFLTVKNTNFCFYLGVKDCADEYLLADAKEWLTRALIENGIGAKTAVGYGYFK